MLVENYGIIRDVDVDAGDSGSDYDEDFSYGSRYVLRCSVVLTLFIALLFAKTCLFLQE